MSGVTGMAVRVLVVGAHHGVGAHVVRIASARGFDVTAFDGDVLDVASVAQAITGKDAVVSTLGPRRGSPPDLCARGTRILVDAMNAQGVRRIVQVTGAMIGHPHAHLGRLYRFLAARVPPEAMRDRRAQERIVVESDLDWTIVRPTRLTNGRPRGVWRDGEDDRVGALARISRADVADAIMRALARPATIRRAWTLQYA